MRRQAAFAGTLPKQWVQPGTEQRSTTVTFSPAAANHASTCSSVMLDVGVISIMGTPYPPGVTENAGLPSNRIWLDVGDRAPGLAAASSCARKRRIVRCVDAAVVV